jgi:hypothetical protein
MRTASNPPECGKYAKRRASTSVYSRFILDASSSRAISFPYTDFEMQGKIVNLYLEPLRRPGSNPQSNCFN